MERRIREGDYSAEGFPPERALAEEVGVSRVTIRRAIHKLESDGLLTRLPNRRLGIAPEVGPTTPQASIAFLSPAMVGGAASADHQLWLAAADVAAAAKSARIREFRYLHWDDPILTETMRDFGAVFLIPSPESIPPEIERLIREKPSLTVLSADYTRYGTPSIRLFSRSCVTRLLNHLRSLGHRHIDCLNAQGVDEEIETRIDEWIAWCRARGVEGELFNVPWEPVGPSSCM